MDLAGRLQKLLNESKQLEQYLQVYKDRLVLDMNRIAAARLADQGLIGEATFTAVVGPDKKSIVLKPSNPDLFLKIQMEKDADGNVKGISNGTIGVEIKS